MGIEDAKQSCASVSSPERNSDFEVLELWEVLELEVIPESNDAQDGQNNMKQLKDFIKCMPKWARCLNADGNEGTSSLLMVSYTQFFKESQNTNHKTP